MADVEVDSSQSGSPPPAKRPRVAISEQPKTEAVERSMTSAARNCLQALSWTVLSPELSVPESLLEAVDFIDEVHVTSSAPPIKGVCPYPPPLLPEGWVVVRHDSGGLVYLHRPTRVCTWSRPYTASTSTTIKKHRVPVHSIPCLEEAVYRDGETLPIVQKWRTESGEKTRQLLKLDPSRIKEYLLLKWASGQPAPSEEKPSPKNAQKKKEEKVESKPIVVPESISKIKHVQVPKELRKPGPGGVKSPPVWKINTVTNMPVSLLYEFCQHYLRTVPQLDVTENVPTKQSGKLVGSGSEVFVCTVKIDGIVYGTGAGGSKKIAKQLAAETTLHLLLPDSFSSDHTSSSRTITEEEAKYFSGVSLEDPMAVEMLHQAGLPQPWHILKECCHRNKGLLNVDEPELKLDLKPVQKSSSVAESPTSPASSTVPVSTSGPLQCWYTLTCGKDHTVSGPCLSKRDGQQLGAQAMLKKLHPHILDWASLLKLYADAHSNLPRLMTERQCPQLTKLSQVAGNEEILRQLKEEMRKLAAARNEQCAKEIKICT